MESKCIKLAYAPAAPAIAMGAMFIVFFIDLYVSRILYRRNKAFRAAEELYEVEKKLTESTKTCGEEIDVEQERVEKELRLRRMVHKQKLFDVAIIEGGIVFHSVMVGLGLGVAGGKGFVPYFVAIAFHQVRGQSRRRMTRVDHSLSPDVRRFRDRNASCPTQL